MGATNLRDRREVDVRKQKVGTAPRWSRKRQETLTVPEEHLDHCFICESTGKDYSVVLVGKATETKLILAHLAPFKVVTCSG